MALHPEVLFEARDRRQPGLADPGFADDEDDLPCPTTAF
jgi:hypothetical protein